MNTRFTARPGRVLLGYVAMLAAAVALFLLVRAWGEALQAPATAPAGADARPAAGMDTLLHVLLALAAIVVVGRSLGWLFTRIGQPPVIAEVIGGILLGPSLLGQISPDAMAFLLPPVVAPYLGVLAQLGAVLYMFLVGMHLNLGLLRKHAHATVLISHASIVTPFSLGAVLALWLYPVLSNDRVPFTSFALFMGVAMSITAFPVLARILTDRRIDRTDLGVVALSCAATDDVTAWCLLAFVIGVAQARVENALFVIALAVGYIALMFGAVRPVVHRLAARFREEGQVTPGVVTGALVALLLSALATEAIGIHAIFGAFLLGAIVPHDSAVVRVLHQKLNDLVTILLLPAFFAYIGMRMQIGLVDGLDQWLLCGAIILVATAGKFGGTLVAGKLTGLSWRDAAALGTLMNTRGLMELIVLNIGLDLGVISPTLFAMMVLMALVTTLTTAPVLAWLTADGRQRELQAKAEAEELAKA
jgi:K+:H+ antiporter